MNCRCWIDDEDRLVKAAPLSGFLHGRYAPCFRLPDGEIVRHPIFARTSYPSMQLARQALNEIAVKKDWVEAGPAEIEAEARTNGLPDAGSRGTIPLGSLDENAKARYEAGIRQGLPSEPWADPSVDMPAKAAEESEDEENYLSWACLQDRPAAAKLCYMLAQLLNAQVHSLIQKGRQLEAGHQLRATETVETSPASSARNTGARGSSPGGEEE